MRIQDTLIHLLLKQPFYGYIAASVTPVESKEVPTIQMSLLPTPKIIYNRIWYEGLCEDQTVGVVIHEILHLILLHPFRKGNRERHLWVVACDMAVNEHIDSRLLPEDAITVGKIAEELKEVIPRLKSAETYYEIISKPENRVSFTEDEKEIKVILKDGQELKANNSTEGDSSEINKNAVKNVISELMEQAQAEGEIPSGISSYIHELYKSHEINWRNVLKRFLSGKGRAQVRKTCKRESKRFENLPGNKRTIGANALVALDESGSISEKQLVSFYNELLAIKKITGANVSVTEFDTECTEPVAIEKYMKNRKRSKNGGTDFRPVFDLADQLRMPLLILFTDGEGTAPEQANQKVLWVLTKEGTAPAAYGDCIVFRE